MLCCIGFDDLMSFIVSFHCYAPLMIMIVAVIVDIAASAMSAGLTRFTAIKIHASILFMLLCFVLSIYCNHIMIVNKNL